MVANPLHVVRFASDLGLLAARSGGFLRARVVLRRASYGGVQISRSDSAVVASGGPRSLWPSQPSLLCGALSLFLSPSLSLASLLMWRLSFCLPEPTHAPSLVQVMAPEKRKQIECGSGNERDQVRASLPSPSCLPRVLTTSPRPMYLRQARAALASDVACKLPVNERNVTNGIGRLTG